jgi:NAD-dependent DNA ligase
MEKGIGEGAVILVTRAGDAIPQIIGVKKTGTLLFPKEEYEWKGDCKIVQRTDFLSKERIIKQILHFVESVDIPSIKEATIIRLYDNGCTSVELFLNLSQKDLLSFGPNLSGTIYNSIQKAFEAPIEKFLSGYNAFGDYIGEKKINLLLKAFPSLFDNDTIDHLDLLKIEGIGPKTAAQFRENFYLAKIIFNKFINRTNNRNLSVFDENKKKITICISGTRDNVFIQQLKNREYIISDSVTKKVQMLLVKNIDDNQTTKVKKANNMKIPILTVEQFKTLYF